MYLHHLRLGEITGCPPVSLVGIDVSRDPGFSGTNFFGMADSALLAQVQTTLADAASQLRYHQLQHIAAYSLFKSACQSNG